MAAPMFLNADDLLKTINDTLETLLQRHGVRLKGIKVGKRNNEFSKGDIFLSRGCADISNQTLSSVQESLMTELTSKLCNIKTITKDTLNSFVIHLDREKYFKHSVTSVLTEKDKYGLDLCQKKEVLLVNTGFGKRQGVDMGENSDSTESKLHNISFDSLRSLVLNEHLTMLLKGNGYTVTNVLSEDHSDVLAEACSCLDLDPNQYTKMGVSKEDILSALEQLAGHSCIDKHNRSRQKVENSEQSKESDICPREGTWEFDMKKYLNNRSLHVGKNGFDVNLNSCSVKEGGVPTTMLRQAVMLHLYQKCRTTPTLVHIEQQNFSFTAQKVDLLIKTLSESEPVDQLHFVYGNVTKAKGSEAMEDFNTRNYLSTRKRQMREAAVMKYGDSVEGQGWEDTLQSLTLACVKFELLSNVARNTIKLKLDSSEDGSGESSLQGSFVMYNCARLSTLLSHFEDSVRKGTYPPLPPVDSVDFSTLREHEEWGLLFNYVYPYPDIVRETINMMNTNQSLFVSFHTHKICQMLIGLSRSVSSYYSRYHVLGEARPHLLPTMYARLYLLKAVHQVMINSLSLMGISPLTQL